MKSINKEELKKMMEEDIALINVLSEESFESKHIPGSENITIGENFAEKMKENHPDKDERIIVYCASFTCQASTNAAEKMEEMGYENIYDYEGGIKDWEEAGYELEGKDV